MIKVVGLSINKNTAIVHSSGMCNSSGLANYLDVGIGAISGSMGFGVEELSEEDF